MTRFRSSLGWLAGVLALSCAAAALAETPVTLKTDLASGPQITLNDLFNGAGAAGSVVVGNGAPAGLNAVLDAGTVQRMAHLNGLEWDNSTGIRRIIVRGMGGGATAIAGGGRSDQMVEVLAYSRSLMAGELVRPEDLVFAKVPAFAAPADAPRDAEQLIGKVTRAALKSGAPAHAHDVSNALVIKRDDLVQVAYHDEGITLTLQAKAIGPAAVGESFGVMNLASKKVFQAVAVGPDAAVVGPEANQIKAASFPNPAQFADNR
jgi:flagella basal body P-ring formation protein FlgA